MAKWLVATLRGGIGLCLFAYIFYTNETAYCITPRPVLQFG